MDLKDPNAAVRAEILTIVRAQVRPHVTAAIFAELMRSFPGAVDLLLERRDAFERGDVTPPELITAAIVEELRAALEPPRHRPRKTPARRPKSATAPRTGRALEQGSSKPATETATGSTKVRPSPNRRGTGVAPPARPPARPPAS